MKTTKQSLANILRELDPNLSPDDEAYQAAEIMLGGLTVQFDTPKLAMLTGYPTEFIERIKHNLSRAKILKDGKIHSNWLDKEEGAIIFWIDLAVATGLMERA